MKVFNFLSKIWIISDVLWVILVFFYKAKCESHVLGVGNTVRCSALSDSENEICWLLIYLEHFEIFKFVFLSFLSTVPIFFLKCCDFRSFMFSFSKRLKNSTVTIFITQVFSFITKIYDQISLPYKVIAQVHQLGYLCLPVNAIVSSYLFKLFTRLEMVTNLCKPSEASQDTQRKEYDDLSKESLKAGDTWYIVDSEWLYKFKQFLGIEEHDGMAIHPGPIDNSKLLDELGHLKRNISEREDYEFVHERLWKKLYTWYGLQKNQMPISRKVITVGDNNREFIEVHPVDLKIACYADRENFVKHPFSKNDVIKHIADFARDHFKISKDVKIRLLTSFKANSESLDPLEEDSTIDDEGLMNDQLILVDCKSEFKDWQHNKISLASSSYMSEPKFPKTTPGLCGLSNLGNTCFMNSVLQCMSNCPPITKYFLENLHLNELNETNPLGMKGLIAKSFGVLIQTMWSGNNSSTPPNTFKVQLSKLAPQFSGYQQHDAQELLTFLLDGLHEDLNRVKKKPYIELKDSDDRPDEIVANESWSNYLKRNDSYIVDYFHALLKSHVICPQCECVSTTFDPFCYLSLPLPPKKSQSIQVKYIPYDQHKREVIYTLCIARNSIIRDICVDLNAFAKLGLNLDELFVAKVSKSHIHKLYAMNDMLEDGAERDTLFIYSLPISNSNTEYSVMPVYLWEVSESDSNFCKTNLIGDPVIVTFPNQPLSYSEIFDIISAQLSRHFTIPESNSMSEDGEMSQYANYMNSPFAKCVHIYLVGMDLNQDIEELSAAENLTYVLNHKDKVLLVQLPSNIVKECHKEVTPEKRNNLEPSSSRLKHSLDDCLALFVTNEKLSSDDAWYCPKCKAFQQATKKFDLWTVPKVLIIHLKRFQYTRFRRDKIDTLVEFPLYDLDISKIVINKSKPIAKYDLVGVINHYGTLGGGHYTAFCKNNVDKKWYTFDDSCVKEMSERGVVSSDAYVLMYIQKNI